MHIMKITSTLPISTIIVGLDKIAELEENIKIAQEFESSRCERRILFLKSWSCLLKIGYF
jgi:predicted aldo/keto reductase-like oxidoreductase